MTWSATARAEPAERATHEAPAPIDASGAAASPVAETAMKSPGAVAGGVTLCVLGGATATLGTVAIATAGDGEWSGASEAIGGILVGVGLGLGAIGTPLIVWGAQDEAVDDGADARTTLRLGVGRVEMAGTF